MTQLKPLLTREQFRLLFPPSSQPSAHFVSDYDISLLYKLIRNISSLPMPQTGWGKPVTDHPRDVSLEANVERLCVLRNEIAGHSATGEMSQQDFNKYWAEVKECVSDIEANIGGVIYQQRLDSLKIADMDPDFVNREITAVRRIVQDIQVIVTKQDVRRESLIEYIEGNNKQMSDLDEIKISLSNQCDSLQKSHDLILEETNKTRNQQRDILHSLNENHQNQEKLLHEIKEVKSIQVDTHKKEEAILGEIRHAVSNSTKVLERMDSTVMVIDGSAMEKRQSLVTDRALDDGGTFMTRICSCFGGPRYDLKRIGKQIAQLYTDKGECRRICINPLDQSSTEDITLVYTDLEIVNTDKRQRLYGGNNVETYEQFLFDQDGNLVKRIYLEGIGGTGKTTFVSRVVLDWTITTIGQGR